MILIFGSKANLLQGRVVKMTGIPSSFTEPGAKSTTLNSLALVSKYYLLHITISGNRTSIYP